MIQRSTNSSSQIGLRERLAGGAVLLVLILVGLGVFLKQYDFNPAVNAYLELKGQGKKASGPDLAALAPKQAKPLGPGQHFGPGELFVKINGKADLYLQAGFKGLSARRFSLGGDGNAWFEALAYEMATPLAAFAVYSQQRRAGAEHLSGARFAYLTPNSLHLAQGPYYLELVASSPDPALIKAMRAMALNLMRAHPAKSRIVELDWLPARGMTPHSQTLYRKAAFGFGPLEDVIAARYGSGRDEAMAFFARRPDAAKARELFDAYAGFLAENGGKKMPVAQGPPGALAYDMLGAYELIFVKGRILAGVHDATSLEAAQALARELGRSLPGDK